MYVSLTIVKVNNAAVLTSERTMNDDGMELSFCVNTLGNVWAIVLGKVWPALF